jgi:hypothetical protein
VSSFSQMQLVCALVPIQKKANKPMWHISRDLVLFIGDLELFMGGVPMVGGLGAVLECFLKLSNKCN